VSADVTRRTKVQASATTLVPDDVRIEVEMHPPDLRRFRVDRIEERILDGVYDVWLTGPIQTKVGRDHSTHRGHSSRCWVPLALAHLALGSSAMRQMLRDAADGPAGGEGA
jgi:hypothetical protein